VGLGGLRVIDFDRNGGGLTFGVESLASVMVGIPLAVEHAG